jgi:hypothetical protein
MHDGGHAWPGSLSKVQPTTGENGPTSLDLHAGQLIWSGLSRFAAGVKLARDGMYPQLVAELVVAEAERACGVALVEAGSGEGGA